MRCSSAFFLTLVVMTGCQKEAPPPPRSGVNVNVPGVSVQTGGSHGGVEVKAPGVEVNVPPK